jgi:chemotaxis protein CheD
MYVRNSSKFQKTIRIIHPGEFYVSDEDEIIGTLLGSCIAVCLHDKHNNVSGMNHFMLPGRISVRDIFADKSAKYGITAINSLIEKMKKIGGVKKNFEAKIFGGGHVMRTNDDSVTIPSDNIKLARVMMEIEDIPIIQSDVGENFTRKLLMEVLSGKVFLKKTTREDVFSTVNMRDNTFARKSFQ